jgi:IPT/TIG domain
MSNTEQAGGAAGTESQSAVINDPVDAREIRRFGICFLVFAIFVFYALVTTWPVLVPDQAASTAASSPKYTFKPFRFFGLGPFEWAPDLRLMLTVIIAGAIGSLIHTLTSFADYVGNNRLSASWLWWFILRTPIGISLALLFYLIIRGGLIVPTLQVSKESDLQGASVLLNPYGIAAFAALAGTFSRQATDKLREVFETVFTAQKAVPRNEPLRGRPALGVEPARLTRGNAQVLTVSGNGFDPAVTATINAKTRDVQWISTSQVRVTTVAEDVATGGRLELKLKNPDNTTFTASVEVSE